MSATNTGRNETASTVSESGRAVHFNFQNTYVCLPERFYARVAPTPVAEPQLIKLNLELAESLGLDPAPLASPEGIAVLAGNQVAEGSEPLAQAYAGHQFGVFVPQLGDGRANLLGEVLGRDGIRYDIQLKGSGRTPFSRMGDGRAALGPVLREYIVSEAMAALGVPTTRALAAIASGQAVVRETLLPGAIFVRVASSHLRVGTFEYFWARGDKEGLRRLADYAISRHYPDAAGGERPYRLLLDGVIHRQADLVAHWMLMGFIHGVMNTDNTSISGETIDYGPCAFMEAFDPNAVFSSIDINGRYCFSNQPNAMHWNLTRLAESLSPLLEQEAGSEDAAVESAYQALSAFGHRFEGTYLAGLRAKLGLLSRRDEDADLASDLLRRMAAHHADFTLTFRRLSRAVADPTLEAGVRSLFAEPDAFNEWAARWRTRLAKETMPLDELSRRMAAVNPAFIPRNHLVEAVIAAAVQRQDFSPFNELLSVVTRPYDELAGLEHFGLPARPEERVTATFCGT